MGLEEKKQVPFRGTAEQERQLLDFIEEHKQVGGCLMPIMQKAQEIYGYLPEEVQKMIADAMGIPMEEVYGVSTFYSQFHLMPKGKYEISVVLVNDEVYGRLRVDDVPGILAKYETEDEGGAQK